jgi:hypothetical protein
MIYTPFTRLRFVIETNLTPEEARELLARETKAALKPAVHWSALFSSSGPVFIGRISESEFHLRPNTRLATEISIMGTITKQNDGSSISGTITCYSRTLTPIYIVLIIFVYTSIVNRDLSPFLMLPFFLLCAFLPFHHDMRTIVDALHRIYADHLVDPDAFQMTVIAQ